MNNEEEDRRLVGAYIPQHPASNVLSLSASKSKEAVFPLDQEEFPAAVPAVPLSQPAHLPPFANGTPLG